jgi:chemotaxis protein methyltransferase CheR
LIHLLLEDEGLFTKFKQAVSVSVTEFFRDPEVYKVIRKIVIPYLSTYPEIRIWNAGCATGQEAYSLAALFAEAGLLDKTYIYATDFNSNSLDIGREGIYSIDEIKQGTANFLKTDTNQSFTDYYRSMYSKCIMFSKLKERITFIEHNLTNNIPFDKFNFIICRNVFIYFTRELQERTLALFNSSLLPNGFLCLGLKESLDYIDQNKCFSSVNKKVKIYRKCRI